MKKLLPLVRRKDTFKLVIPDEVEKKIGFLCKNIWDVEWSGVLFYKVSGSFEDKSLVITCVDIFQMDEGTGGYTEYNMSPDVVSYMCGHPELLDEGIYQGLIHSHNRMPTFFSGTDTGTLSAEGNDMNHFVSLIVNNEGKYTAAVTRRFKATQTIVEDYSYPTWGGTEIKGQASYPSEEECIEYFFLDIDKATNSFENEMFNRIKEIREAKKAIPQVQRSNLGGGIYVPPSQYMGKKEPDFKTKADDYAIQVKAPSANIAKQTELPFEEDEPYPYGIVHADEEVVDSLVKQIVTSSVIIPNNSQVDIKKWAANMDKLYKARFDTVKNFENFATNYIDFLINDTDPMIDPAITTDMTEMAALLAYDVREKLEKLPKNPWLDVYIKMLDDYIL